MFFSHLNGLEDVRIVFDDAVHHVRHSETMRPVVVRYPSVVLHNCDGETVHRTAVFSQSSDVSNSECRRDKLVDLQFYNKFTAQYDGIRNSVSLPKFTLQHSVYHQLL